jgi:hypothetical protein
VLRVRTHPYRRCIYREADEIVSWNLDTRENVGRLIAKYREEGFPENFGLAESGYMLRKHHADAMIAFAEEWWPYVRDWSRRDQLSFNRVLWKNPIAVEWIDDRVAAGVEELSRGRDRGPFFNATFNFFPTRGR